MLLEEALLCFLGYAHDKACKRHGRHKTKRTTSIKSKSTHHAELIFS